MAIRTVDTDIGLPFFSEWEATPSHSVKTL
jgi:hypothetical protein